MDTTKRKERLVKLIEALEKSYDNLIDILNKDIDKSDKEDDKDEIKLKDTQTKVYAEGIQKASETACNLLEMITTKQAELDKLNKPEGQVDGEPKQDDAVVIGDSIDEQHPTAKHLN